MAESRVTYRAQSSEIHQSLRYGQKYILKTCCSELRFEKRPEVAPENVFSTVSWQHRSWLDNRGYSVCGGAMWSGGMIEGLGAGLCWTLIGEVWTCRPAFLGTLLWYWVLTQTRYAFSARSQRMSVDGLAASDRWRRFCCKIWAGSYGWTLCSYGSQRLGRGTNWTNATQQQQGQLAKRISMKPSLFQRAAMEYCTFWS